MPPLSMHNATAAAAASCASTGITAQDGTPLCSWAPNPSMRGTLDILYRYLCISTLGLCVWNAVHPDIPSPGTPQWRVIGKRIWWLVVGLFMPEMLVLTALGQFRLAYMLLIRVRRETSVRTELPWWMRGIERVWPTPLTGYERLSHDQVRLLLGKERPSPTLELSDMTIPVPTRASHKSLPVPPPQTETMSEGGRSERKHPWTLTHSFYAVIHGFVDADGDVFRTRDSDEPDAIDFDFNKGIKRIDAAPVPDLSADDLNDRSKAGAIAKALLVWQLFVFIANCAARWNQELPLSLLEITTLAHCLCSLIALLLWWYKPHSVGQAIVIDRDRTRSLSSPQNAKEDMWTIFRRAGQKVFPGGHMDVPRTITILSIAVLYGLPHLLGLSIHFPTSLEQRLWRIATYLVICSPIVLCIVFWIVRFELTDRLGSCMEVVADVTLFLLILTLVILYASASMFIVGESVHQIFALWKAGVTSFGSVLLRQVMATWPPSTESGTSSADVRPLSAAQPLQPPGGCRR